MTHPLKGLSSGELHGFFKPPIFFCFGDVVLAIGEHLEKAIPMMQGASEICAQMGNSDEEMVQYGNQLRYNILLLRLGSLRSVLMVVVAVTNGVTGDPRGCTATAEHDGSIATDFSSPFITVGNGGDWVANLIGTDSSLGCAILVGVVGDICRALDDRVVPYCDGIMTHPLKSLSGGELHGSVKPPIVFYFWDVVLTIGEHLEKYLPYAIPMMQGACEICAQMGNSDEEMVEYGNQLRRSILLLRLGGLRSVLMVVVAITNGGGSGLC
ncbi:hypothetical protein F0562_032194 [Nyssa sinensis]|uniref:Importin subunit beta-1/Transportin-1-like TPR repeats domain-containing protein n=1 Tax=Nyssa sinensis TaxID=561372 RepID=A0A5J5AYW2_9ASTE|nr:hypothetical protein F0562_032194 [Nyssa sinensis]